MQKPNITILKIGYVRHWCCFRIVSADKFEFVGVLRVGREVQGEKGCNTLFVVRSW